MKYSITALLFALLLFSVTSCDKEEIEDLGTLYAGVYTGGFENSSVDINPYEILVTRVSDIRVRFSPVSGTDFTSFERELNRANVSTTNSVQDQGESSVVFTEGIPNFGMVVSSGDFSFVGERL